MNFCRKLVASSILGLLLVSAAAADTLELKDGRVLQGRFLGGTQAVLRFAVNGEVKTFSVNDIVALTFTSNYHGSDNAPPPAASNDAAPPANNDAPPPSQQDQIQQGQMRQDQMQQGQGQQDGNAPLPDAPVPPPAPATPPAAPYPATATGGAVTLPAGQTLLIRMIDSVDSKKNNVGDVFHASLETDLLVNGVLVARRGSDVYGKLDYAKEAGHFSGSAELELQLTSMVINGATLPLVSDDYSVKGKGRGGDTAKKVGGGAILGAIVGGIVGGGPGAAVGAGVGGAAGAGVQLATRGKEVKVPSETLLEFRLQQPTVVSGTGR